jgi:MFS transporter, FHS family, glucose/mannose:H+ symporter
MNRLSGPALLYAGFVLTGIVNTVLGPVLPWLAKRWMLSDAEAGSLFAVQFAGGLAGGAVSGFVVAWIGAARTMAAGCVMMAAGLLGLGTGGHAIGSASIGIAGLGLGFIIPTTNLMSARLSPHRAAAALGAVNLCWGLGAALWPLMIVLFVDRASIQAALFVVCVLLIVMAASFTTAHFPEDPARLPSTAPGIDRLAIGRLAMFGTCIALYSGIEAAFGGWITEYARRLHVSGTPTNRWEIAASTFWGGVTFGRALVALWLRAPVETRALFAGIGVVAASIVLVLVAPNVEVVLVAGALCGLALAPIFPVTVAALAREFPTRLAGPMVAMGSVGAGALPLLVGAISAGTGSLSTGLASLLLGAGLLAALQWLRLRRR